jgi:ADP-ribosylglycohydrolase
MRRTPTLGRVNTTSAPVPSRAERVRGCLLGGALGDALGYAVETETLAAIRTRFGPDGLGSPGQLPGRLRFSDDTQLSLYTVDGLLEALEWANQGVGADETACLWLAYLRWLRTQGEAPPSSAPVAQPRWIDAQEVLHARRGPGKACLSGLLGGEMGTRARPVNPDARGSGTVMRSAPFGLLPYVPAGTVDRLAMDAAALTHGHPVAQHAAAATALMIRAAMDGRSLRECATTAIARFRDAPESGPAERLEAAVALSEEPAISGSRLVRELGTGWVAEEALAIAVYAALVHDGAPTGADHFRAAVHTAVNHDGDSDTTAAVTGNLLGACYGAQALPPDWVAALEGADVVSVMAESLVRASGG